MDRRTKTEIVFQLLKKERQRFDVCGEHDLKQSEINAWVEEWIQGGKTNLKANLKTSGKQTQSAHAKEVKQLLANLGELVMDLEAQK